MDSHIVHARNPRNEIPPICGLPLFAWASAAAPHQHPAPSLLDLHATRIAARSGRPVGVVRLHLVAAGVGGAL